MFYFKICNFISVFSCLMLCIVEVSWNSNNCFFYFFFKIVFSIIFKVLKNYCWNFLRSIFFIICRNFFRSFYFWFDRDNSIWICYCLMFCSIIYDNFIIFEWYYWRSCMIVFWVSNDFWFSFFKNCYCWVCCI